LGYDTIYALQDLEDDALVGVKSTARRFGHRVPVAVAAFYGFAAFLALACGINAGLGPAFYVAAAAFALHLLFQVRRLKLDEAPFAWRLFNSTRGGGLILFLGFVAGQWR